MAQNQAVLLARAPVVGVWNIELGRLVLCKTMSSADMSTLFGHDLLETSADSEELCLLDEHRALEQCCASRFKDEQQTKLKVRRLNCIAAEGE